MAVRPLILGQIELDSGDENLAAVEVNHPSRTYEGRVLDWGYTDRSISVPSGEYQGADSKIRIADTDLSKRDILATQTALRRRYSAKLVNEGESEAAKDPFIIHEIRDFERVAGAFEFTGRDQAFSWMDKYLIGIAGNRTNFPYAMDSVDQFFVPILFGSRTSTSDASPPTPQGIVTLPQITMFRWMVCQHLVVSVSFMRRNPGEDGFTMVDPSEYTLIETGQIFDGVFYEHTILEFNVAQPVDCEIRIFSFEGIYKRGAFGSLPALQPSPMEALRNPIDLLVIAQNLALGDELTESEFNTQSFSDAWDRFEILLSDGSPPSGYKMDCAIVRPMTIREFIGMWCRNVEADYFVNRSGQITVKVAVASDPNRPVLSDGPIFGAATDNSLILMDSFRERAANPCITRLRYNFDYNYATDQYVERLIADNEADQAMLQGDESPPIRSGIIEGIFDMELIADPDTALDVVERRLEFLALGSYRIEVKVPLVETELLFDLADMIGITRYDGMEEFGHFNREFKVTGITDDLNNLVRTVRGVLRVPISLTIEVPEFACSQIETLKWAHNQRVGPFFSTDRPGVVVAIGCNAGYDGLVAWRSNDYGETWRLADDTYPTLTEDIESADAGQDGHLMDGDNILCATQQHGGRLALSIFDMSAGIWISKDVEVVNASVPPEESGFEYYGVGVCRLSTGEIVLQYDGEMQDVSGLQRRTYIQLSDDEGVSWTTPEMTPVHTTNRFNICARPIADPYGQLTVFTGNNQNPFFGHCFMVTRKADGSWTSTTEWTGGGGITTIDTGRIVGDYCVWTQGGVFKIGFGFRHSDGCFYAIFNTTNGSATTLFYGERPLGDPTIYLAADSAVYPQAPLRHDGTKLHIFGSKYSPLTLPNQLWHKSAVSPFQKANWLPSAQHEDQAGPLFDEHFPGQEIAANVVTLNGEVYCATMVNSGNYFLGVLYNLVKVTSYPDTRTVAEFAEECALEEF